MAVTTKPLISLDDIKNQLPVRAGNVDFDPRLRSLINVATAQIELATHRNFTRQSHVEFQNSRKATKRLLNLGGIDTFGAKSFHDAGTMDVSLEQTLGLAGFPVDPAQAIEVRYDQARLFINAVTLIDSDAYTVDDENSRILLRFPTFRGIRTIRIKYTAGFDVPDPAVTGTTFDPLNKDASITLSNGDLTAAHSGAGIGSAYTVARKSAGKFFAEFTVDASSIGPPTAAVGFALSAAGTAVAIGEGASSYGYRGDGAARNNGASGAASGDPFGVGDTISLALDLDNGAAWFALNGVWQNGATQAEIEAGDTTNAFFTGLSGEFLMGTGDPDGTDSAQFTANFGGSTFAASVPTGFSPGFGEVDLSNQNLSASIPEDLKQACIVQAVFLFKKLDSENVGSGKDKKKGSPALDFLRTGGLTPEAASFLTRFYRLRRGSG